MYHLKRFKRNFFPLHKHAVTSCFIYISRYPIIEVIFCTGFKLSVASLVQGLHINSLVTIFILNEAFLCHSNKMFCLVPVLSSLSSLKCFPGLGKEGLCHNSLKTLLKLPLHPMPYEQVHCHEATVNHKRKKPKIYRFLCTLKIYKN